MAARREKFQNEYYFYVSLYLEDLRSIEEVLHGLGAEDNRFAVNSTDWTAEDLDEILAKDPSGAAREIKFTSYTPYVTVEIQRRMPARIYSADGNGLQARGAVAQIGLIMRSRQRMTVPRLVMAPLGSLLLIVVAAAGLGVEIAASGAHKSLMMVVGMILVLLTSAGLLLGSRPRWKGSLIYLVNRTDRTGFFERNRDQLILALIVAVLSVLGTLLVVALT